MELFLGVVLVNTVLLGAPRVTQRKSSSNLPEDEDLQIKIKVFYWYVITQGYYEQ